MSNLKQCNWCLTPTEKRIYCNDACMKKAGQYNWIMRAREADRKAAQLGKLGNDTLEGKKPVG